ncbi:NifB/NifX family molybdenum-iron cluster-binding protein [Sulfurimonas sp. HSL3-7]|uniref:NifB/NifX family molybdenum-iron cluster-binding protein n=1 Tax=Sulfonitrofixus jiaomeiensis TaxID=3131938 RepID=UPI0031FA1577
MLAVAVKTDKENTAVSPLFGKAKFFAFYDGKNITIEKNEVGDGIAVINWFAQKGVDTIIVKEMGSNPYKALQNYHMKLLYAGDERIEVADIIKKYEAGELNGLNASQMQNIIAKHEKHHTHPHGHEHGHTH